MTNEWGNMVYVLVRHKLKDFEKWKHYFDGHANVRKKGGSIGGRVFQNIDNPNEAIVIFKWDTIENARKFTESDELKQRMKEAGVTEIPNISFIEEVERVDM